MHHQSQVPLKPYHDKIVEEFRKSLGTECTTLRMLEAAEVAVNERMPQFNEHHLTFFRALLLTQQTEAPITSGFAQDQLLDYAERIGRYNGMLDQLAWLVTLIENQLAPQQE